MASALSESVAAQPGLAGTIQREIEEQASNVRAEILAEFFSKNTSGFFEIALQLEAAAFAPEVVPAGSLPSACQAIIGVLADFSNVDRKIALPSAGVCPHWHVIRRWPICGRASA
jgi:hypothetical protein